MFRFRYPFKVRYHECDMQGIVFNANYMTYVDVAITEYFRNLGYTMDHEGAKKFDFVLVHFEVDFRSGAKFDQDLWVGIRCERIGNSSFDVPFAITRAADDSLCAEGYVRYVAIDGATGQSRPVPDHVRAAIARHEGW